VEQLLTTKLFIPKNRPDLVSRPRLLERMNAGLHRKLTLVSAPAGFGKTTLVSEWIATCDRPVAWFSLEKGDSDPSRFLTYLVAALQTIVENIGEDILGVLQSPQPPLIESILIALINEIAAIQDNFILVLDDYHVLDSKPVDEALAFLLEHLSHQMHLVITTREDPNLPLSRFRARGELTEIRVADLRFTLSEAAGFLNQMMGLELSAEDISALETRTEGWIAGLQLAALSMREQEDVTGFIRAFAGDHRYSVDYLVEEVLLRQTERIRNFLLQTSILGRLSGPLCDAVTGQDGCSMLLESLDRSNLFIVPLDEKRQWYRYHHLFGDVLRAHLMEEQPDQASNLHQRASEWHEHNGSSTDAICHALAAQNFERAADLVELAWSEMDRRRQSAAWLGWAKALPDELVRTRPVLSVGYGWALLDNGDLETAEPRLRDAEQWLERTSSKSGKADFVEFTVVDREEFQHLPATIAAARAYHALALGDVPGTIKYTHRALDLLPEDEHHRRGTPAALLGLASLTNGDLETADTALTDAMMDYRMAGNILFSITGTFLLADIRTTLGRLRQALNVYQQSLQLAEGQGKFVRWGTADLYTGLGELYREQNNLEAAGEHLLRSKELGEQAALPRWRFRWCTAQARLKEAQGDLDGALDLLEEAERAYVRGPVPDVRPVAAMRARVWIKQGQLEKALDWAREQNMSTNDDLSYLREFEHITLARMFIAQFKQDRKQETMHGARELLARLQKAAEAGGRTGSLIEILALQALAHELQGEMAPALAFLERALNLAEPEGYTRIFVDEGDAMGHLLAEAERHGVLPEYSGKLLAAFNAKKQPGIDRTAPASNQRSQSLVEPLSERELEILQLIAQGCSNHEICDRLFLAMPTVKGHNRNIFGKLQVKNRTQAVARARELSLL
jgi:LuxR family transcriptional regulator, maltose regulon positive regulatory protein